MTAHITIDPGMNRDLGQFPGVVEGALTQNRPLNSVPLELVLHDDQLRNAVIPLEQNLSLLRILYPIAIAVAALLSVGLALLIMLQNAKNAAIMRVLGRQKSLSQLILIGEQVFVCTLGVVLGLLALLAVNVSIFDLTPLLLALLYFTGVGVGSIIGAVIINAKTPLELLQTRE